MTYNVFITVLGGRYGYSIRDGRNSTVAHASPRFRTHEAAEAAAKTRAEKLVETDALLGRRSEVR